MPSPCSPSLSLLLLIPEVDALELSLMLGPPLVCGLGDILKFEELLSHLGDFCLPQTSPALLFNAREVPSVWFRVGV